MNSINIREKFELFCKEIQRQFIKNFGNQCSFIYNSYNMDKTRREDVNDHPQSTRLHHPSLQMKIFNYFEKWSAMIHIQLIVKLYMTFLSLQ